MVRDSKDIKLVAIDLDGTLYNTKSQISKRNLAALRRCLDYGIKIIITTAKTVYTVRNLITELGLKDPQVASAGAAIISSDLEVIYTRKIPLKAYSKAIKLARQYEVGVCTSCVDGFVYIENDDPSLKDIWESGERPKKTDSLLDRNVAGNALLLTFAVQPGNIFSKVAIEALGPEIKLRRAWDHWLTGCSLYAGKMGALKKILSFTGIRRSNAMAIGDSESDLGMISLAGFGVAMGNASKALKDSADYIVSDNDNDGVAEAIELFVFNGR